MGGRRQHTPSPGAGAECDITLDRRAGFFITLLAETTRGPQFVVGAPALFTLFIRPLAARPWLPQQAAPHARQLAVRPRHDPATVVRVGSSGAAAGVRAAPAVVPLDWSDMGPADLTGFFIFFIGFGAAGRLSTFIAIAVVVAMLSPPV